MESHLSELEQLPWPALVEEAQRRGVPSPETMERSALVDAIRARERSGGRGPLSLARSLLGRVVHTVRAALPSNERRSDRPPPPAVQAPPRRAATTTPSDALPAEATRLLSDPELRGLRVIDDASRLALVWRVSAKGLARAEAIAAPGAEMRLHTVRVSWPEDAAEPRVSREDHGSVHGEGTIALGPAAPGEKIVAAIGLAAPGGDFVAIEHATHG